MQKLVTATKVFLWCQKRVNRGGDIASCGHPTDNRCAKSRALGQTHDTAPIFSRLPFEGICECRAEKTLQLAVLALLLPYFFLLGPDKVRR